MSTLKLRSGNCVKWRPPKKDGPSCDNWCHFPNLIFCRSVSVVTGCAPTNSPVAIEPPSTAGSSRTANLLKRQGSYTFISWPSSFNWETIPDRHPDMSDQCHLRYSGSFRTLGSPCMNAFSPSANVSSEAIDARICSVILMDDSSGVGQLRSISWISGSL